MTVAGGVERHHLKPFRQERYDEHPHPMVKKATVNQDERVALAHNFVVEVCPSDLSEWHAFSFHRFTPNCL